MYLYVFAVNIVKNKLKATFNAHDSKCSLFLEYLAGPYYAGPNSTPAPLTPVLITPRQNLGLPSLRAAFNATVRKIRKLINNKEFNYQERLLLSEHLI